MISFGWIYAVHEADGGVVYVGQTKGAPIERFREHLRDAAAGSPTPFHVWLQGRVDEGMSPRVSGLERIPATDLDARERHWIGHYAKERGWSFLNVVHRTDPPPEPSVPVGNSVDVGRVIDMMGLLGDTAAQSAIESLEGEVLRLRAGLDRVRETTALRVALYRAEWKLQEIGLVLRRYGGEPGCDPLQAVILVIASVETAQEAIDLATKQNAELRVKLMQQEAGGVAP